MPSETERLLVERIRKQDADAWRDLINLYEGRLWAFLHRRIANPDVCDDLVQDTFIGFLASLPHFDHQRELQTYLFSIASYKLTDHLRRLGRHPEQQVAGDGADPLAARPDSQPAPSSVARGRERVELEEAALAQHLGDLIREWQAAGEHQRVKALELLYVKGLGNKEVAARVGLSEQQIANLRFGAVKKLGDRIRAAGLPSDVFPDLRAEEPPP